MRNPIKIILILLLSIFIITGCSDDLGSGCYVTSTGSKYHKGNCKYLKNSKIPIGCDVAPYEGYSPCSVCKP